MSMATENKDRRVGMDSTDSIVNSRPVVLVYGHVPDQEEEVWLFRDGIREL